MTEFDNSYEDEFKLDIDTSLPAWWISWYSPQALGGFTLYWPWWRSGWSYDRDDNEVSIFVAAVRAESEDDAYEIIMKAYDNPPVFTEENKRFCELFDAGEKMPWEHENPRFPFGDWMQWA